MSDWPWPWEQGTWPTPEQLWKGLNEANETDRHVLLDLLVAGTKRATECAEEDHEGIAQRLSSLLCELTNGRMSKTNYDVHTMVAEIDSVYTEAQQEGGP